MESWFYFIPLAGVLALLFALIKAATVKSKDPGNETMQTIAGHIREGARAFLRREYTVLSLADRHLLRLRRRLLRSSRVLRHEDRHAGQRADYQRRPH